MKRIILPLLLGGTLAAMGSWIYFYELEGESGRMASELDDALVFPSLQRPDILAVGIENDFGTYRLHLIDGLWKIESPIETSADAQVSADILSGLVHLRTIRKLDEGSSRLTAFGLDRPQLKLKVETTAGVQTLLFGEDAPFGGQYYAQVEGASDVLILQDAIRQVINRDLNGLRDRHLLRFESDTLQAFQISGPNRAPLDITRKGQAWWADVGGATFRLERRKVDDLLFALKAAKGDTVISGEETAGWFDEEGVALRFTPAGDAPVIEARLFPQHLDQEKGQIPALRLGTSDMLSLPADILDTLEETSDTLRDRVPLRFDRWQTQQIDVNIEGQSWVATKDEHKWRVAPSGSGWDRDRVTPVMDLLLASEAERFYDQPGDDLDVYGLVEPTFTLTFKSSAEDVGSTLMMGVGDSGRLYAKTTQGETIFLLPAQLQGDLNRLFSLSEETPPPAE